MNMQKTHTAILQARPIVRLHIGNEQTQVTIVKDKLQKILTIGLNQMGQGTLTRFPPKPFELEMAIEELENNIMPLAHWLPKEAELILTLDESASSELTAYFVADMKGRGRAVDKKDESTPTLQLNDVENIFIRLAEVAEGGAVSASGLPKNLAFITAVLIVREFMHHLGFHQIHFNKP